MKNSLKIAMMFGAVALFTACKDDKSPNYQYMPNMYESVAYETYAESDAFNSVNAKSENGKEGQIPPDGTIKRGHVPYELPNSTEGYEASKAVINPFPADKIDMKKAEELYVIYCAICHGTAGDGKGKLVTQGKYLGVPNYKDRQITEGSVNHVLMYGLNSMGSYANQLNREERWMVSHYVMQLKSKL